MAMRLITTCNKVKAAVDIPRIMAMTMLARVSACGEPANCTAAERASHREGLELCCRVSLQPKLGHDALDDASRRAHFLNKPGWRSRLHHAI
jgi:hypothetical protein